MLIAFALWLKDTIEYIIYLPVLIFIKVTNGMCNMLRRYLIRKFNERRMRRRGLE